MARPLLVVAVAVSALSAFVVGCAAQTTEPTESALQSTADELATSGPNYEAGTVLKTTTALNLRSGPSTHSSVLRVMPNGSHVTVRQRSGGNAWVAISFNGYSGWAHTTYLSVVSKPGSSGGGSSSAGDYSASRGGRLAQTALRVDGRRAGGWCALETSNSVERSGIIPAGVRWYRNNAVDMGEYFNGHPSYLRSVGFLRADSSPYQIKEGSIIVWRRGQCGYNARYGHIEISVDGSSSRACSDFCGRIAKSCGNPYVYMPTRL